MSEHEEVYWLSAFIDDDLTVDEKSRLESHLPVCEPCREELAALRQVRERLSSAPRRAMPPDLIAQLESEWNQPPSRVRIWVGAMRLSQSRRWAPAAAFVAILGFGIWLGFFRHNNEAELPIEILAAAHSRYSAEGLIPGDMVASNFSKELATYQNDN